MQTFLPYSSFIDSAKSLDTKRLGNQRNEAMILHAAITKGNGWSNHPAARMWRGYPTALLLYAEAICLEWRRRGHQDTVLGKVADLLLNSPAEPFITPPWLGDEALHRSHRSNLLRKLPEHYSKLWPDCPADLPYVWPVPKEASSQCKRTSLKSWKTSFATSPVGST